MEEKKCPVDRGKVLIGLECCLADPALLNVCSRHCPYGRDEECTETVRKDALAYIYYLEERLGVTG
ncbi:MAG: hypothetical protein SPD95_11800 [Candidatus Faecousia sp.]|nr:hypothetical protein [Candidatus Faecousia sp.]